MSELNRMLRVAPVTSLLMLLNALAFLAQQSTGDTLTRLGLLYGPAVAEGQWWRLLSSGFLHDGILHVGFNMYLLYMLGRELERGFGSLRFSLMYFGSLFGAALAVMLFDWPDATLGASGAVLGLAGAFALALHERGIPPQRSPLFGLVILNLALPLLLPGISFWGHFGGVIAGALMAYLLIWIPMRSRTTSAATGVSMGTGAVVMMAALSWMVGLSGGLAAGL